MLGAIAARTSTHRGRRRRDLPDHAHPPGDPRPGHGHVRPAPRRTASRGASAPARRSTSTSSVTAGHRSTCASSGSRRRSTSSASCGRGEQVTHRGAHFTVENARIYDPPETAPPIVVSAFGPARRRGGGAHRRRACGCRARRPTPSSSGATPAARGPVYAQLTLCWAEDRDDAVKTAHRIWPNTGVPGQLSQDLPTPAHFEQASSVVTEEQIADVDGLRARSRAGDRRRSRRCSTPGSTTSTCTRSGRTRRASAGSGPSSSSRGLRGRGDLTTVRPPAARGALEAGQPRTRSRRRRDRGGGPTCSPRRRGAGRSGSRPRPSRRHRSCSSPTTVRASHPPAAR